MGQPGSSTSNKALKWTAGILATIISGVAVFWLTEGLNSQPSASGGARVKAPEENAEHNPEIISITELDKQLGSTIGDLREKGDYQGILSLYDKILEIDRDNLSALTERGATLVALGRYEEAMSSFDQALDLNADYAPAWGGKGVVLSALGQHEEAIDFYDQALKFNPVLSRVWHNKGVSLIRLEKHEEAIDSFDRAIAIDPSLASALFTKGALLSQLNRHKEAVDSFAQAQRLTTDDIHTDNYAWFFSYGLSLGALEQYEEALENLDKSIEYNPDFSPAWNLRGVALESLGRNKEAIDSYEMAIKKGTDSPMAINNLRRIREESGLD